MSGTAAIEKCHAMIRSDHVSEDTNLHEENTCSIRGTKISKNPTSLLAFHTYYFPINSNKAKGIQLHYGPHWWQHFSEVISSDRKGGARQK